ncbi:hypothetical protein ACUXPF_003220, partial [Sphingomonas sanguinis]
MSNTIEEQRPSWSAPIDNQSRPLKKACAKSAWRMAGDAGHRGYAAYQAAAA